MRILNETQSLVIIHSYLYNCSFFFFDTTFLHRSTQTSTLTVPLFPPFSLLRYISLWLLLPLLDLSSPLIPFFLSYSLEIVLCTRLSHRVSPSNIVPCSWNIFPERTALPIPRYIPNFISRFIKPPFFTRPSLRILSNAESSKMFSPPRNEFVPRNPRQKANRNLFSTWFSFFFFLIINIQDHVQYGNHPWKIHSRALVSHPRITSLEFSRILLLTNLCKYLLWVFRGGENNLRPLDHR